MNKRNLINELWKILENKNINHQDKVKLIENLLVDEA